MDEGVSGSCFYYSTANLGSMDDADYSISKTYYATCISECEGIDRCSCLYPREKCSTHFPGKLKYFLRQFFYNFANFLDLTVETSTSILD